MVLAGTYSCINPQSTAKHAGNFLPPLGHANSFVFAYCGPKASTMEQSWFPLYNASNFCSISLIKFGN
jgi:hypothetical protein